MRYLILALALSLAGTCAVTASPDLAPCVACHGEGASTTEGIPSLGGMPATYVTNQLFMFREGQRTASPMNDLAKPMTDDDLVAYANAVAALPPPHGEVAGDAARVKAADASVAKHRCQSCHGKALEGSKGVPRLAGQREDYLAASLLAYRSSERAGFDPQMNEVAAELGEGEIRDLAYALSRR